MEYKYINVFVQQRFDTRGIEVWIHQERSDGIYNLHFNGENIDYQKTKTGEITEGLKPLIVLPHIVGFSVLKELAIQAKNIGVKPENESRIEGKFEATEKHLSDMRVIISHLMKLPEKL